jgi:hypothetical protein
MRSRDLRTRILVAIGASGLAVGGLSACGGDDAASSTASTGGAGGVSAAGAGGVNVTTGAGGSNAGSAGSSAGSSSSGGAAGSNGASGSGGSLGSTGGAAGETGDASTVEDAKPKRDVGKGVEDAREEVPYTVRRPFLVGSSLRSANAERRDDWRADLAPIATPLDRRTAEALSASWQKDALEEHASIAAFARFTMLLLSVGAPPDLIADSQRASLDEIKHARACFALARRYGSGDVGPGTLEVADSLGALSLADLAALTVQEGCVGETLGALLASEQLAQASDPEVTRILRRVVADENRHAELAWRFVKWAVSIGGHVVEARVAEALQEAVAEVQRVVVRDYGVDLAAWHAHGRLSCAEAREVSARGVRDVVLPCMDAILRGKGRTALTESAPQASDS